MENRGSKGLALAALLVGIVGLTIGFAAFASTLTINSTATVSGTTDTFKGTIQFGTFTCDGNGNTATVDTDGTNLTVAAKLANPGDSVKCTGTITNSSSFTGYLNSITGFGVQKVENRKSRS